MLQLDRAEQDGLLLPASDTALEQGDELLFAGSRRARARLELALRNEHALDYVLSGREPRGWLWDKLSRP